MATVSSTQYAGISASPVSPVRPIDLGGRVRVAWFDLDVTAQAVSSGDTINLTVLPKGSRVIGGSCSFGAQGNSSTVAIGVSGNIDVFLVATSTNAAGTAALASKDSQPGISGNVLAADTTVIATVAGGNWTTGKQFKGYLFYVID